jgi:hypothetical protein
MESPPQVQAYLNDHTSLLQKLQKMWSDPRVQCYNDSTIPREEETMRSSVFLMGPTSRNFILNYNWRCQAHDLLRKHGYDGWIFVPEPRGQPKQGDFTERGYIHRWESSRILAAKFKMAWIPRDAHELLGLNTNLEIGIIIGMVMSGNLDPGRVFMGWPDNAERMGLPNHYAVELAKCRQFKKLRDMCVSIALSYS